MGIIIAWCCSLCMVWYLVLVSDILLSQLSLEPACAFVFGPCACACPDLVGIGKSSARGCLLIYIYTYWH